MRIARVRVLDSVRDVMGVDGRWREIADPEAPEPVAAGPSWASNEVTFLSPSEPRVVLGMAHNSGPSDRLLPAQAFMKSARSVIGPGAAIRLDPRHGTLMAEAELAVVIGAYCRNVRAADAAEVIRGYTVGNDVTAIDQIARDEKMVCSKSGDGFTPIGPWIQTRHKPESTGLRLRVNGELRRESDTDRLAYTIAEQIEFLSEYLTLGPGDIILSGAPDTSEPIAIGDVVRVECEGIGYLENPVHAVDVLR